MRQVGEAELMWRARYELRRIRAAVRNDFKSGEAHVRQRAEDFIATAIVRSLRSLEILSAAPLPEGSDLFSRAAYGSSDQAMMGEGPG